MSFLERPPGESAVDQTEDHGPPRSVGARLTEFRWDGTLGLGILEFAHTRSRSYTYQPSP